MKLAITALLLFIILFTFTNTQQFENDIVVTQQLVDTINSAKGTWIARINQGPLITNITFGQAKKLCTVLEGGPILAHKQHVVPSALPQNFDSRTNWPNCPTIKVIRDQSACGSCWAFGAAEAISDRTCVYGILSNWSASVTDLLACCSTCGSGCNGGYPSSAWHYWTTSGLVDEDCYPYPFPSCDHHVANSTNPCPSNDYKTPVCNKQCKNGENFANAKRYGQNSYTVSGETQIMTEIFHNGPVETSFNVYEDFLSYSSGIYIHKTGRYVGGHSVKIIGWGVESNTAYWIVANSWNTNWGEQGFFRILKGANECGIENQANAGVPK
eukprot:TRINITY_DN1835_c0_g1_i1.p1 TRINITY_DN1835_c0_g1~~TRINITY_DN1835_c0_g1_i1.p1  ORF type:complete len:327 (+),score=150.95 TRINITY_DN1835_c0_g1_i1:123-1103(+)